MVKAAANLTLDPYCRRTNKDQQLGKNAEAVSVASPCPSPRRMVPAGPSFADFKFSSIGQAPGLLQRLSEPTGNENYHEEEESNASPASPDPSFQYPSRGITPRNSFMRPTLLQALSGEDISQLLEKVKQEASPHTLLKTPLFENPFEVPVTLSAPFSERAPPATSSKETSRTSLAPSEPSQPDEVSTSPDRSIPSSPSTLTQALPQTLPSTSTMDQEMTGLSHVSDSLSSSMQTHLRNARDLQVRVATALSSLHVPDLSTPLLAIQTSTVYAEKAYKDAQASKYKIERCRALLDELFNTSQGAVIAAETAMSYAADAVKAIKELSGAAGSEPWKQQTAISGAQDDLRAFANLITEMEEGEAIRKQKAAEEEEERKQMEAELVVRRSQTAQTPDQHQRASVQATEGSMRLLSQSPLTFGRRAIVSLPQTKLVTPQIHASRLTPPMSSGQPVVHIAHSQDVEMTQPPFESTSSGTMFQTPAHGPSSSPAARPILLPPFEGAPVPRPHSPANVQAETLGDPESSTTAEQRLPELAAETAGRMSLDDAQQEPGSQTEYHTPADSSTSDNSTGPDPSDVPVVQASDAKQPEPRMGPPNGTDMVSLPPSSIRRSAALGLRPRTTPSQQVPQQDNTNGINGVNHNGARPLLTNRLSQLNTSNPSLPARLHSVPPIAALSFDESPSSPEEESPIYAHSQTQEPGNVPIVPDPRPTSPPQVREANLRHIREMQIKSPRKAAIKQEPSIITLVKTEERASPQLSSLAQPNKDQEMLLAPPQAIISQISERNMQPPDRGQPQQSQTLQPSTKPVTPSLPSRKRLLSSNSTTTSPPLSHAQGITASATQASQPTSTGKETFNPPSTIGSNASASLQVENGPIQGAAMGATDTTPTDSKVNDRPDILRGDSSDRSTPPIVSLSPSPDPSPRNSVPPSTAPIVPTPPATTGSERRVADIRAQTQLPGRPTSPMQSQTQSLGKRKQPFDSSQDAARGRAKFTKGQGPGSKMPSSQPQHSHPPIRRPSPPAQYHRPPSPLRDLPPPASTSAPTALSLRIGDHWEPGMPNDRRSGQPHRSSYYDSGPPSPPAFRRPANLPLSYERPDHFQAPGPPTGPSNNHRGRAAARSRGNFHNNNRGRGGGLVHSGGQHHGGSRSSLEDRISSPQGPPPTQSQHLPLALRIGTNPHPQPRF